VSSYYSVEYRERKELKKAISEFFSLLNNSTFQGKTVDKIYEEDVEPVLKRLGDSGDLLILIDYDNLEKDEASMTKLLDHIESFSSKLSKENSSIEKKLVHESSKFQSFFHFTWNWVLLFLA
jgi:hypothetical protein